MSSGAPQQDPENSEMENNCLYEFGITDSLSLTLTLQVYVMYLSISSTVTSLAYVFEFCSLDT